jgi:hypothetical protein
MAEPDKFYAEKVHDFKVVLEFDYPCMGFEQHESVEERTREALGKFLGELKGRNETVWPVRASIELQTIDDDLVPHHKPLVVEVGNPDDY